MKFLCPHLSLLLLTLGFPFSGLAESNADKFEKNIQLWQENKAFHEYSKSIYDIIGGLPQVKNGGYYSKSSSAGWILVACFLRAELVLVEPITGREFLSAYFKNMQLRADESGISTNLPNEVKRDNQLGSMFQFLSSDGKFFSVATVAFSEAAPGSYILLVSVASSPALPSSQ